MEAKLLVQENNRKRELLTTENEAYYGDLMVYIRLQLSLSEQQTEEILMELLNHLLEGQKDGKTARQIFGDDPKGFADEIIEQLPQEEKRNVLQFIAALTLNVLGLMLIVRSAVTLIVSFFIEVDMEVNLFKTAFVTLFILSTVGFGVWFIFRLIRNSLFTGKGQTKMDLVKAGLFGSLAFLCIMLVVMFIPAFGPSIYVPWWFSLIAGMFIWLIYRRLKNW